MENIEINEQAQKNDELFEAQLKDLKELLSLNTHQEVMQRLCAHLAKYPDKSHFERVVVLLPKEVLQTLHLTIQAIKRQNEEMHVVVRHWLQRAQ